MKKNSRIILIIVFLSFYIIDCSPRGGYSKELSGHYYYRDVATNEKDILCHLPDGKNIYSKVISYDFNKDFIIVAQQPIFEAYRSGVAFDLRIDEKKYPTNSKEEIEQSERVADSLLTNDPYYRKIFSNKINYWIISNKINQVFGPFTKEEFLLKRKELGVPENLKLHIPKSVI